MKINRELTPLGVQSEGRSPLYCFRNKTKMLPKKIPTVQEVMRWIAMLGGFLGRKGDGQPGTTTTWRGWQKLREITETWEIFNDCSATYG